MGYKYEWGSFSKGKKNSLAGTVEKNSTYDIYFTATGSQAIHTYFDLYNFTDDLDLKLYQYSAELNNYPLISVSQEQANVEESIFKVLAPGDYILEISHYSDLDYSAAASAFTVDFDSDSFYENSVLPNDALFTNQWHLLNTGQAGGVDNEDIAAPEAWNIRSTSPDVVVAVIDAGMQLNHPDLINNLWKNSDEIFGNGIDDDNNGYVDDLLAWNFVENTTYVEPSIHGTHVAGIIGAEGNNGIGIAGVTWDVQLMSLDVFNGDGKSASYSNIWEAIYYAADNGADVINMSLRGIYPFAGVDDLRIHQPNIYYNYYNALSYAVDRGVTVVIAAGNDTANLSTHLSIPAAFSSLIDGVISVAAITNTGERSNYTNYGSMITIAAPGGSKDIDAGIHSSVPYDNYKDYEGTSMASPIVAGAAALIKAENPNLTPADIESIITDSADKYRDMTYLVQDGNYLNLANALILAQVFATHFADNLSGSNADDEIRALEGDDLVASGAGDDLIYGNQGEDTIKGGLGNDILYGGKDSDLIIGNQGEDDIYGNLGDDLIYGGKSNDWLHGGKGDDVLYGNLGADVFNLSAGSDRVMDFETDEGDRISIRSGITYSIQAQGSDLLINADIGSLLLVGTEFSSFNSAQSIG